MRRFAAVALAGLVVTGCVSAVPPVAGPTTITAKGALKLSPVQVISDVDLAFETIRPIANGVIANLKMPDATKTKIAMAEAAAAAAIARMKTGTNADLADLRTAAPIAIAAINDIVNAVDNPPGVLPPYVRLAISGAEITVNLLLQMTAHNET